ncbi:hypothetical protein [Glaciecola sp. KUL10]|uniref:hypothetical protein n=1 Tax=Glaciecola sp. (strain KUL10) TaxID=2161813 RepID=UPI000D7834DD|nr:hypothetical protein [Glaciecola sp. KUL10]GBL02925.1 hypothetical protein KUL10_01980 [Glaciecola sp. KUL10]
MKYTIIDDATNEIIRVLKIPNAVLDVEADKEAFISDVLELELEDGQIAIEGNYPPELFTYDGFDFHEIEETETRDPILWTPEKLLVQLINELRDEGYMLPLHRKFMKNKEHARDLIDLAASQTCEKYVSKGKFTLTEYMLVSDEVKAWRTAGSPSDAIPEMLADWLEVSDFSTAEEAAVDIETQSSVMKHVIRNTRKKRLAGKRAVTAATIENFKDIAINVIAEIENIQP